MLATERMIIKNADDIVKNADISLGFDGFHALATVISLLDVRAFRAFRVSRVGACRLKKRTTPNGIYRVIEAETSLEKENVPPWGDLTPRGARCVLIARTEARYQARDLSRLG